MYLNHFPNSTYYYISKVLDKFRHVHMIRNTSQEKEGKGKMEKKREKERKGKAKERKWKGKEMQSFSI